MKITKTGFYKLIEDLSTRNATTIATIPKGTIIEITQIDHPKVIGPELYDWIWYDLPVIIWEEMKITKEILDKSFLTFDGTCPFSEISSECSGNCMTIEECKVCELSVDFRNEKR